MAIYDLGTASLAANGEVTGVGTTWKAPLTLIRVGATIVFKTEPVQIYTISEIISDTQINVYNPNSETVPAGTGYAILAHDGITVQGLAQDVAETLRYYQSRETEIADAVDAFNNFDSADFESKVTQVNTQHGDVVNIGSQVEDSAIQVAADKDSAASSAASASSYKDAAAASAQEAADYAASLDTSNLLRKDLNFSDVLDKTEARDNLQVYSKNDTDKKISRINVIDFGADPTGISDSAQAFQDAFDYASDLTNSIGHGAAIYIPGGKYSIGSQLTYTWRGSQSQDSVNDGDTRRLVIIGDGSAVTFINDFRVAPGPSPLIRIDGGSPIASTPNDPHLRFYAFGFRIQRSGNDRQGWGIHFTGCSIFKFEQVDINWFSNAFVGRDLIHGVFSHCQFGANELGVSLERGSWTNPNVIVFDHAMFGGNNAGCAYINDGANVKFTNCTFEGTVTNNRETSYCIRYTGAPSEGGVGLSVDNCYFENNNVRADILIANDTTQSVGTHLISGNSFQRTSSTSYCVNHIETRNSIGANGKFKVSIRVNSFKLFGHPHIEGNNSTLSTGAWGEVYDDGSNNYEPSEKPNYSDIGGASGYNNAIVAAGKVAASAVIISGSYNLASVIKPGVGVYDISFTKPLSSELSFPTVTLQDSQAYAITSMATVDGIRVSTFSSGGAPVDSSFNIVIVGTK